MIIFFTIQQEVSHVKTKIHIDEDLIVKIGEGDKDAFTTLYHLTDRAIFGFALSILKNKYDAEDVMQDSFIQIRRYASAYKKQGTPMAWILTIVKHLSYAKRKQSSKYTTDVYDELTIADDENEYEKIENAILLNALLNHLSDQERTIVVLHAQTGMKHREIANILELPLSTVLSKYRRALQKMNDAVKQV